MGVECTSGAVCNLILYIHGKAAQLKNVEFVILDSFECAAEHDDWDSLNLALDVTGRGNWLIPPTHHLQSRRTLVCMEKLIQHALTGSLDPDVIYRACEWLGINRLESASLVVETLALAQKCAFWAFVENMHCSQVAPYNCEPSCCIQTINMG